MQIIPVNYISNIQQYNITGKKEITKNKNLPYLVSVPTNVNFQGVNSGGYPLKMLVKYGMFDMYTGRRLMDPKQLENMLNKGVFNKPLKELIPILEKYTDMMGETSIGILTAIKKIGHKNPNIKLNTALEKLKPEHEIKLLNIQRPIIFERLTDLALNLPDKIFPNFIDLLSITNKRISSEFVTMPFSAKELLYKLQRVRDELKSRNNAKEIRDINTLIKNTRMLFDIQHKPYTRKTKILTREEKLKRQMQKPILRENITKLNILRNFFEQSSLSNNKELKRILNNTSAKIYASPTLLPFKRKEFVHDLKQILRTCQDKDLTSKIIQIAHTLPTSTENVSAFIVKYAEDSSSRIGFCFFKDMMASIDHLCAKNNGGKNKLSNFGLCSVYINAKKTNIPFDEWCRQHPETAQNCQKHVDRLIELYHNNCFKKVGLDKNYIIDFAKTVKELSPKENPIVLNLKQLDK